MPNLVQMSLDKVFCHLINALDSAHEKYDVWTTVGFSLA